MNLVTPKSAENFVASSCIYHQPTSCLNQIAGVNLVVDQTVADLEHGLHSILTHSMKTPELDVYFGKSDIISSVSSGFLCAVSAISDNSKLACFCHHIS